MSWECKLALAAEKDLRTLPSDARRRIARVLDQMTAEPLQGDTRALKGSEWKGVFRRRVGSYRIFFTADHQAKIVMVIRIVRRSEKTYR
jgi:mRNA-degrading endonuclease RelE of RelBE toxin-antitoxin system